MLCRLRAGERQACAGAMRWEKTSSESKCASQEPVNFWGPPRVMLGQRAIALISKMETSSDHRRNGDAASFRSALFPDKAHGRALFRCHMCGLFFVRVHRCCIAERDSRGRSQVRLGGKNLLEKGFANVLGIKTRFSKRPSVGTHLDRKKAIWKKESLFFLFYKAFFLFAKNLSIHFCRASALMVASKLGGLKGCDLTPYLLWAALEITHTRTKKRQRCSPDVFTSFQTAEAQLFVGALFRTSPWA